MKGQRSESESEQESGSKSELESEPKSEPKKTLYNILATPNPNSHGSREKVKFPNENECVWMYHNMDEGDFYINHLFNMTKLDF